MPSGAKKRRAARRKKEQEQQPPVFHHSLPVEEEEEDRISGQSSSESDSVEGKIIEPLTPEKREVVNKTLETLDAGNMVQESENVEQLKSVETEKLEFLGGDINYAENQGVSVKIQERASWMSCCGLFELIKAANK